MRRYVYYITAVALSVGVAAWIGSVAQAGDGSSGDMTGQTGDTMQPTGAPMSGSTTQPAMTNLSFPPGIAVKDLHEESDIRNALKVATTSAVDRGEFDDVVSRLVDADRDRIGDVKKIDRTQLDNRIDEFRRIWQAKYNQDFKLDENTAFNAQRVAILQGEITDPAQLAGHWPVPPTEGIMARASDLAGQAQPAAQQEAGDVTKEANKWFGGEVNLNKGRNVALVGLPASHDLPAVKLSLIHELPDIWRFDIPDNITGQQLSDGLAAHLAYLNQHQDQWPSDINDAGLMLTHHVAMALYGVQAPGTAGMQPQGQWQQH